MAAGSTYSQIATQTLGSATSTITFSSIPQTYTNLVLVSSIKGNNVSMSIGMRINGDTGSNYSVTFLEGDGSSAGSSRLSSQTSITLSASISYNSSEFGTQIMNFNQYSNTSTFKSVLQRFNSASGGSFPGVSTSVGLWRSTSAITQLDLINLVGGNNFATGSTFTLYGIRGA